MFTENTTNINALLSLIKVMTIDLNQHFNIDLLILQLVMDSQRGVEVKIRKMEVIHSSRSSN